MASAIGGGVLAHINLVLGKVLRVFGHAEVVEPARLSPASRPLRILGSIILPRNRLGQPVGLRPPTIFNLLRSSDNVAHLEWENGQKVSAICGAMP